MTTPRLTAEAGIGPAMYIYSTCSASSVGSDALAPMASTDGTGDIFSGILDKVPCLLSCGVPRALSIALRCGMDEGCWLTKAPSAGLACIKQCLA